MMSKQKTLKTDEEIAKEAFQLLVAIWKKTGCIGLEDGDRAIQFAKLGLRIIKGGK